ncbi:MAG: anthrone oxygenase family protein [Flavobacteriaceae bacterium]
MEISLRLSTLLIATLLTGLSAGLCFTWSNAVTTGLARLDDVSYLQAFQQMNRTIINPVFLLVFFGPSLFALITTIQHRFLPAQMLWMLIFATVAYFLGVTLVTVFGNVPINEALDSTDLSEISDSGAQALRTMFEDKWTKYHLIRTYASILSFSLLILVCLWRNVPETI